MTITVFLWGVLAGILIFLLVDLLQKGGKMQYLYFVTGVSVGALLTLSLFELAKYQAKAKHIKATKEGQSRGLSTDLDTLMMRYREGGVHVSQQSAVSYVYNAYIMVSIMCFSLFKASILLRRGDYMSQGTQNKSFHDCRSQPKIYSRYS